MAKSPIAKVSPAVMKWVVETGGLAAPDIAKKLRVPESDVQGWMQHRSEISVAKLERLSNYAKRPLAVFLLDEPPAERALKDYRTPRVALTRDAALAVRAARYWQEASAEMMDMLGCDASPRVRPGVAVRHSPERAAAEQMRKLGMDAQPAGRGKGAEQLYGELRDAVESVNVHVFERGAKPEEMRCLSLSESPCAILVNSREPAAAKRFALLHGYGHILLGKGGLCAPLAGAATPGSAVESWCSKFALFALMPRADFAREFEGAAQTARRDSAAEIPEILSDRFAVSLQAAAAQAVVAGLAAESGARRAPRLPEKRRGSRPGPVQKCVGERGRKFVSLVLESWHGRMISGRDALCYLDTDLQRAPELAAYCGEGKARRRTAGAP